MPKLDQTATGGPVMKDAFVQNLKRHCCVIKLKSGSAPQD